MKKLLYFVILSAVLFGCTTVPISVPLPWNRSLSDENIPAGAVIAIEVQSQSTPLLGSESLVEKEIADKAASLLTRRGFKIADQNYQYKLKISYQIDYSLKSSSYQSNYTSNSYSSYNKSTSGGYGVILAQMVALSFATNKSVATTFINDYDVYYHTIACEFLTQQNRIVRKYDTRVESKDIDILRVCGPLLQIAFSELPKVENIYPRVPKLNEARFSDFIGVSIRGRRFRCPALPNYIRFATGSGDSQSISSFNQSALSSSLIRGFEHSEATMAYLDLLETAEYALPACNEKLWVNPVYSEVWKKVVLIGKYYLGSDAQPVNVIVYLSGTPDCYIVTSCQLVNDDVYTLYQNKYNRWVQKLSEFYNFFQR